MGPNAHRYARSISPGLQEWVEAVVFERYLGSGCLLTFEEASEALGAMLHDSRKDEGKDVREGDGLNLGYEDYILGLFDATGELMRFAITAMATTGALPVIHTAEQASSSEEQAPPSSSSNQITPSAEQRKTNFKTNTTQPAQRTILSDLQSLLQGLVHVDAAAGFPYAWRGKMEVAKQSTEKVEKALYGLVVRGAERPKGWRPDVEGRGGEGEDG